MAVEDVEVQKFVTWRIFPIFLGVGIIWYYKRKGVTLKSVKRKVVAFIVAKGMSILHKRKDIAQNKKKLFSELTKQIPSYRKPYILEIGVGGGGNFSFYPSDSEVLCLDPNPCYETYIRTNANKHGLTINRFIRGFAEDLGAVEDASVDAVVCTFVLCSVFNMERVLKEIRRVLKPKGAFYFLEHVADKRGTCLNRIQRLLNPVWYAITGDCQINREIGRNIESAGFSSVQLHYFYFRTYIAFFVKPMMWGVATN